MTLYEDRFGIIPLPLEHIEHAVPGELVLDRKTATVWTVDGEGNHISSMEALRQQVEEIIESTGGLGATFNYTNRQMYRFYYDSETAVGVLRLDQSANLSEAYQFFLIRDIATGDAITDGFAGVRQQANYIRPLENNKAYLVMFYNADRDAVGSMIFTACHAAKIPTLGDKGCIPSYLDIKLNRYEIDQTELDAASIEDYISYRVLMHYDETDTQDPNAFYVDVTDSNQLIVSYIPSEDGRTIKVLATYIYDTFNGLDVQDEKDITITNNEIDEIVDVVVVPRLVVTNDQEKQIRLNVVAYFESGLVKDVGQDFTTQGFDDKLFNTKQYISVSVNYGHVGVFNTSEHGDPIEILVTDSGDIDADRDTNIVYFADNIMVINELYPVNPDATTYKVRSPYDLNFYYTIGEGVVSNQSSYIERAGNPLAFDSRLIVEFFDVDGKLVDSDLFYARYNAQIVGNGSGA